MSRKRPHALQNFYDAIQQINIQDLEPRGDIISEDELNYNSNLIEIYSKQKEDLDQIKFDELELKKSKCEQILKTLISRKREYERRPQMLYLAAINGNLELVRKLIKENVRLEISIAELINPKQDFDINVQFQIISDLLYAKAADVSNKPVILHATRNCNLLNFEYNEDMKNYLYKIIKLFLSFGADPNQIEKEYSWFESPLYYCVLSGGQYYDLTRLLIDFGADVNYKFTEYHHSKDASILKTSLWKNENQEEALLLIEKGADPNFGNPLLMICDRPSYIQVIQQLLKAGADPNVGNTIEKICKTRGVNCLDILKELLKAGANPNNQICFEEEYYVTNKVHPIRVAFRNDNYHYLEVLFQASIKLDINDKLLLRDIEVVVNRILQKPKQEQGNYLNFMSRVGYCDIVFDTIDKRLIFETFTRPYIIEELARTRLQPDNISYISTFL